MSESVVRYATRQLAALALAALLVLPLILTIGSGRASAPPGAGASPPLVGFARISDGDTIAINGERIRIEGIDAPESGQRCTHRFIGTWDCGGAAAAEVERMVRGKAVSCERRGLDKYGRTLATCYVDGADIGAALVRKGLAWAFVRYSQVYVAVEAEAKRERRGIWQADTQPAWEYRANRWSAAETAAPQGCAIKGNVSPQGRIYHMPWSPWYHKINMDETKGKRWFCTEADALAAGWRPAQVN